MDHAIDSCDGKARERLQVACRAYVRYWLDHPDEYRAVFMIEDTLICALAGICHMLVTVSEHSWPPPDRLLGQALRMVDGPLDE